MKNLEHHDTCTTVDHEHFVLKYFVLTTFNFHG